MKLFFFNCLPIVFNSVRFEYRRPDVRGPGDAMQFRRASKANNKSSSSSSSSSTSANSKLTSNGGEKMGKHKALKAGKLFSVLFYGFIFNLDFFFFTAKEADPSPCRVAMHSPLAPVSMNSRTFNDNDFEGF